jgi:hypothetical protein
VSGVYNDYCPVSGVGGAAVGVAVGAVFVLAVLAVAAVGVAVGAIVVVLGVCSISCDKLN